MPRALVLVAVILGLGLIVEGQSGTALFNLQGTVDSNNSLVVALVAAGSQGGINTIGNLRGKVDANNSLLVAIAANSAGNAPIGDYLQLSTVNTAAPGATACDAAAETGRVYWDSTNDVLWVCSGLSGWRQIATAAP